MAGNALPDPVSIFSNRLPKNTPPESVQQIVRYFVPSLMISCTSVCIRK